MNRTQKLGNVLIISSRKRMLSEFQSYLHSVLGEYLTFNTLLREQATDPSLFRGYQCVLFPTARAMETFPLTLDSSILQLPCDRVFNHMFLDKIIQIPPHERVYLVYDDKYSTLAIISQLEECGVTQYDFVPFYPGCKSLTFSLLSPPASRSSFLPAFRMCWISATVSSIFPLFYSSANISTFLCRP